MSVLSTRVFARNGKWPRISCTPGVAIDLVALAALVLLATTWVSLQYEPYTFIFRDGSFYATTTRALATDATLRMERFHPMSWYLQDLGWNRDLDIGWSNLARGSGGEMWPKHSVLLPLVAVPFFCACGPIGLLIVNVCASIAALFGGYRIATRVNPAARPAALVALGLAAFFTSFRADLYSVSNDVFYAALIVVGVERALARRHEQAGLLLGLSIFVKVTNLVIVLPLLPWLLAGADRPARTRFVVAFVTPIAALAAVQWRWFGAPWISTYSRTLARVGSRVTLGDHAGAFRLPSLRGVWEVLRSEQPEHVGLVRAAPLTVLAAAGLLVPTRWSGVGRRARAAMAMSSVAGVVFYASYQWSHYRFLMPFMGLSVPFAAAPIHALLQPVWARLAACARGSRTGDENAATSRDDAAQGSGDVAAHEWRSRGARAFLRIVGASAVLAMTTGALGAVSATPWSMASRITEGRVFFGAVPCDYFNPSASKWECSHHDRSRADFWGAAVGGECRGGAAPGVRLAPPWGRKKEIRFTLPEALTSLTLTAAAESRGRTSRIEFLIDGRAVWTVDPSAATEARTITLRSPGLATAERASSTRHTLVVRLAPGSARGAVCVDAVEAPRRSSTAVNF